MKLNCQLVLKLELKKENKKLMKKDTNFEGGKIMKKGGAHEKKKN